jgi:hypothetical protein
VEVEILTKQTKKKKTRRKKKRLRRLFVGLGECEEKGWLRVILFSTIQLFNVKWDLYLVSPFRALLVRCSNEKTKKKKKGISPEGNLEFGN